MGVDELRICLVGFGSIARTHASAIAALPAVRELPFRPVIDTLVSERPAAVADAAAALGIRRVCTLEEALADPGLEAFDVTTRNDRHLAQAEAILRAGRALYIEKPVGRTPAEAARVAHLAEDARGVAQVGLVTRYDAAVPEARALVRAGAVGEIRQARLALLHGSYLDPARPMSWRLQSAVAGGGAMIDLGLHMLDLARFLLGEPALEACRSARFTPQRTGKDGGLADVDVDDWAWAELRAGTAHVTVEASRVAFGAEGSYLQVFGTEGSAVAELGTGRPVRLRRFDGDEATWLGRVAADPEIRAVAGLRPPARLSLGPFVDSHAAGLLHFLLRVRGSDPAPGYAPLPADSAAVETLAAAIVGGGTD